jgi:hypothetical protein
MYNEQTNAHLIDSIINCQSSVHLFIHYTYSMYIFYQFDILLHQIDYNEYGLLWEHQV